MPTLAEIIVPGQYQGDAGVSSVEELLARLHRIAADCPRPVIATVVRADGDMLSIGLKRPVTFLTYTPKDDMPPYLSVFSADQPDGEVCFDYNGEPTFYSARNTIPVELGMEVMRRFVLSSGLPLPDIVTWETA